MANPIHHPAWPAAPVKPTKVISFRTPRARRLRVAVFTRDDFTCRRCRWRPDVPDSYDGARTLTGGWTTVDVWGRTQRHGRYLEVDHIFPRLHGGPSTIDNLQTLCDDCNSRKGARIEVA